MSGIAGLLWLDGKPAQPSELQAMADTLRRRGPDGCAQWCEGSAGMLRALLATTPEATAGPQPWQHPDSKCVVVSDTRLDNRPELLRELGIEGHCDRIGDGELLHAAWQRWGEECPARLLGDFAFAVLDTRRRLVFCARDPMGVRPLVYHHQPGRLFAFASQTEALLAIPGVPGTLDEARIADYLCGYEGIDRTSTFFRALLQLPAGHSLTLRDGALRLREHWSPLTVPRPTHGRTQADWVEGLSELTTQAVKANLRASTSVGSMLSGGLDSSSVVAVANALCLAEGKPAIETFSAISQVPGCPETAAVRQMASLHPQQAHLVAHEEASERFGDLSQAWAGLGEPFDASMTLHQCQYALAAERGVRVVMDGADPDSLLSEGDYLATLLHRGRWLRALREADKLARFHGMALRHVLRPSLLEAFKPIVPAPLRRWRRERGIRQVIASAPFNPGFARRMALPERYEERAVGAATKGTGVIGTGINTPNLNAGILRYDRVASRWGIEPRHPFLDRRLLEYCAWMPQELRLRDGYPKWALRQAMSDRLPGAIAWRRGKEHLGYRFNYAVLAHVPALSAEEIDVLAPYMDAGRLASLPDPRQLEAEDPRAELLFNAAALARWLLARGAGARSEDAPENH